MTAVTESRPGEDRTGADKNPPIIDITHSLLTSPIPSELLRLMPNPVGGGESYLGQDLSLSQLLHATRKKLQDNTLSPRLVRIVAGHLTRVNSLRSDFCRTTVTLDRKEVKPNWKSCYCACVIADTLFRFRSTRSNGTCWRCSVWSGRSRTLSRPSTSINQVPPEVFSLISDYRETDEELIRLTHVCHGWRGILILRASSLDCRDPDKTGVYIQRSRGSPLEIYFAPRGRTCLPHNALLLLSKNINRSKALTLAGCSPNIPELIKRFGSPAPLLENLFIDVIDLDLTAVESTIFGGNLSLLRELRLWGVLTTLPWKNMSNLTTLDLRWGSYDNTQLLNFFEHTPLLRKIALANMFPDPSNAPAKRVVSLPHLTSLEITDKLAHSILLNHLHIPTGALVTLRFTFDGERSPILDYLPRFLDNLQNISHITSINVRFGSGVAIRVNGPSGGLYVFGHQDDSRVPLPMLGHQILRSLNKLPILTTERLAISLYHTPAQKTEASGPYQVLLPMSNLRVLTLSYCDSVSFLLALNPSQNTSNAVVCPKLEELVLYILEQQGESEIEGLLEMVME